MSRPVCPCCGKIIDREISPAVLALFVQLPPAERTIFETLCLRIGQWVKTSELLEALYGADPEGGPHTAPNMLSQYVGRLRDRLTPLGLAIDGKGSWGDSGRRLRWIGQ